MFGASWGPKHVWQHINVTALIVLLLCVSLFRSLLLCSSSDCSTCCNCHHVPAVSFLFLLVTPRLRDSCATRNGLLCGVDSVRNCLDYPADEKRSSLTLRSSNGRKHTVYAHSSGHTISMQWPFTSCLSASGAL